MAGGWAAGFKGALNASLPLIVLGLTMKIMEQGGEIMGLLADWDKTNKGNVDAQAKRPAPAEHLKNTIEQASTPQDVEAAKRLGEIMRRDAMTDGNDVLVNQIDAIMGKFDELVGKQVDHTKATKAAEDAEKAFAQAMLEGKAAAGDSAAQIQEATNAVDKLAQKLGEAGGAKLDTSSFESLLKGLESLDKSKLGEESAKDVAKLIDLAGKLRDLKADAAKDAEQQAQKQKKAADDLREAEIKRLELQARAAAAAGKEPLSRDLQARADALKLRGDLEEQGMNPDTAAAVVAAEQAKQRQKDAQDKAKDDEHKRKEQERLELARQVADLEDEIARHRAEGDKEAEKAAQDRLSALQLARRLEDDLVLSRAEAEDRARARIADERAASDRDDARDGSRDGGRYHGPARLSDASTWGDPRKQDGLRGDGSSSIDAFNERQNTPLRDTFQFPGLDAFAEAQGKPPAADATPTQDNGTGNGGAADQGKGEALTAAAKEAATAAAKARDAAAKTDAELLAEFQRLSSELEALAEQNNNTSSQLANNRS